MVTHEVDFSSVSPKIPQNHRILYSYIIKVRDRLCTQRRHQVSRMIEPNLASQTKDEAHTFEDTYTHGAPPSRPQPSHRCQAYITIRHFTMSIFAMLVRDMCAYLDRCLHSYVMT